MSVPYSIPPEDPNSLLAKILGISPQAFQGPQIVDILRKGLSVEVANRVARYIDIPESRLALLLGTSTKTLSRRKKDHKPLDATESDRLHRLARIFVHASEVFEDCSVAQKWLKRPNRALGGAIPLDLLDTDAGTEQVDELLDRIDYGVYS